MRFWIILVASVLFISCKSKNEAEPVADQYAVPDTILAWDTNADSMTMKRDTLIPDSAITINRIINGLNEKYPEVSLVFLRQGHDTIFTSVPDAEYLGEQMGDAGAAAWFADVVINLTSVAGINYVSFSMETQSHAASGVISREKYNNWKRQ
jgi:hypothetical protein